MTEVTRRRLLGGAAAAAAATALTPFAASPLRAAAPLAGKQAPSYYRAKLGDFEITVLSDGARTSPIPDGYVKNVGKDQVLAAAEAAYMPKGQLTVPFNPMVVNTGSKLILLDTGFGPGAGPTIGLLQQSLAGAGIDAKQIDTVIITHMHPDHSNGLKTADGALVYPNAEIKVPAVDWAFWMSDDNMGKAEGLYKNFFQINRKTFTGLESKVTRYDWGKEVAPGVTAIDTSGHTPGHTALAIASGSSRVLFQADVTNVPELFVRNPDWHVMFDYDPVKAAQTRRKFYDMAVAEKALISGFHYPFPSLAHIEKAGTGFREIPIAWNPTL
jgi:glyoxylase-like metal-dependent hydrolase (beta-lactamase superfamily II)